jgi:glucose-1-phosphate thymidylyltransferase
MLAGIRDILIISTPKDLPLFKKVLGKGKNFGVNLSYSEQPNSGGIAQAFLIGEKFIGKDSVCLILGDNIFYGQGFSSVLKNAASLSTGCKVFSYQVANPEDFGIIELNSTGQAVSIEEKPMNPKSNLAITGLYFYDNDVIDLAKSIKPSERGELEITSINEIYLNRGDLSVQFLGRGFSWLDTGTHISILEASHFVHTMEKRQGIKIACLEEIAWRKGWISTEQIEEYVSSNVKNDYFDYLSKLIH